MTKLIIYALLIIPLGCTWASEMSGVIANLKYYLFYKVYSKRTAYRHYRIKPLDCAMCLSWWTCLTSPHKTEAM